MVLTVIAHIEMGNDAMQEDEQALKLTRDTIDKILENGMTDLVTLYDANGNSVGQLRVEKHELESFKKGTRE